MATFYGINSNSVNTLFSSLSGKTNSNHFVGFSNDLSYLSEYSNIRNGSYRKLADAYYKKYGTNNSESDKTTNTISNDSVKELKNIKTNTDDLNKSSTELLTKGSKSVFTKVDQKNSDGTVTNDYDRDKISDKISEFANDYNKVIKNGEKSGVQAVNKEVKSMINTTKVNENLLKSVGISVNSDNTLSVDEAALKKADVSTLRSLFNTTGSYGYSIGSKASQISSKVSLETGRTNTYTNTGSYSSITSGELYDSLF